MLSPVHRRGPAGDGEPPAAPEPVATNHQLLFKKHKVLPHPRRDIFHAGLRGPRPMAPAQAPDFTAATTVSAINCALSEYASDAGRSLPSSPLPFQLSPQKLGSGPDLPPTPPAHSRNSSSTHSVLPPSTAYLQSPERSTEDVQIKPPLPITPTKQMSPPTPDVTPPNLVELDGRPKGAAMRSVTRERGLSKGTTDSQSESFETAPETLSSAEEEDDGNDQATLRPIAPSARTSESTVRRVAVVAGPDEAVDNGNARSSSPPNGAVQGAATAKARQPQLHAVGLGLGLESSPDESLTPKSKRDFGSFDGEWAASGNDEVVQEWDDNLDRNVVVRKRRGPLRSTVVSRRDVVIEDTTVPPTNATQAVRSMSLPQRILTFPAPKASPEQTRLYPKEQQPLASAATITAQMASLASSLGGEDRRVSTVSSKSTASPVVEAYPADAPLQRRKTLRHVKKHLALRDSVSDMSPVSSAPTSLLDEGGRQQQQQRRPNSGRNDANRADSMLSTSVLPSVSSRSARRDIFKAGGIPVIVMPDRRSSTQTVSREPSLRSTSSRRSKRSQSQSVHSVPMSQLSGSRGRAVASGADRRSRTYSESDGSAPGDQRTFDYPPIVPRRTSSLSAPTSRNGSRSGSLTTESVKAHAELLHSKLKEREEALAKRSAEAVFEAKPTPLEATKPTKTRNRESVREPVKILAPKVARESKDIHGHNHNHDHDHVAQHDYRTQLEPWVSLGHHGDPASNTHLSPQNTPFSVASVETAASHHSHAEVSEALAVSIYAHQNTSILMVDHSTRPSECSSETQPDRVAGSASSSGSKDALSSVPSLGSSRKSDGLAASTSRRPDAKPSGRGTVAGSGPVTPHPIFSMDDVDSPLRNPRAPPAPPAINFIPATPSGLTPAPEKQAQLGNYFGDEFEDKPRGNVSTVLRRVLTRGRRTEYGPSASRSIGLLGRTLSLTRGGQRGASGRRRSASVSRSRRRDSAPAEEGMLHPFWRPASFYLGDDDDLMRDDDDDEDEYYRYPPIDNRPHGPRRSLSSRMKRTFAILPIDDSYPATSEDWPERRTVRRTPSGNLRVVKHRMSTDSAGGQTARQEDSRPQTAPQQQQSRQGGFWRTPSFMKRRERAGQYKAATGGNSNNNSNSSSSSSSSNNSDRYTTFPQISDKIGERGLQSIPRRLSERRREKRSNELRQKISAPREVRDGVGEVIRRSNYRDAFTQAQMNS